MRTWITSSPIARPIFIIVGDFNAKVGSGEPSKSCTAAFGLGTGNSRGDSVINFAERQQLKIMNTFFKKSPGRRWIWISPNWTPGSGKKLAKEISSTLSGKKSIDGQVTLHGYLITVGPSEQQSGSQEIGPENRVVLDGETISPDSLDPYGQD